METRKLEKIARGFSNHRRIEILALIDRKPNLSVIDISQQLRVNFKTISEHIRRLAHAGLVTKKNMGAAVEHTISPLGRHILKFLRTLE
jgi:predicted ArsR family transcriptional regulator